MEILLWSKICYISFQYQNFQISFALANLTALCIRKAVQPFQE